MELPYAIATHKTGTFVYFSGGAVRRVTGLNEAVLLKAKTGVDELTLKDDTAGNAEAKAAAAVSKTLFGI